MDYRPLTPHHAVFRGIWAAAGKVPQLFLDIVAMWLLEGLVSVLTAVAGVYVVPVGTGVFFVRW